VDGVTRPIACMRSRSVSITGATGFIGWHLAEAFRDAGWVVRAIVRPGNTKPLPDGIDSIAAALGPGQEGRRREGQKGRDGQKNRHRLEGQERQEEQEAQGQEGQQRRALTRAVEGCDVLVHAAGLTRARRASAFDAVNVSGTRAIVDAVNTAGARLIAISSQAAIGPGSLDCPSREDDAPRPMTPYGRSKLAAETVVRSCARVPWTIVRPSSVYGPRDRQFLPVFRFASRGLFLQATDPATPFTFIYIDDLTRGVLLAAGDEHAGRTMFLGHPDPLTAEELLKQLATVFGRRYRPRRVPRLALRAAALAGECSWLFGLEPVLDRARLAELGAGGFVCAVDRARDLLGFTAAVPLQEGVERTARWYRNQGWV
jgi:nucleoside-diphosphate-sugar epimerase